jgi:hypothetical protein
MLLPDHAAILAALKTELGDAAPEARLRAVADRLAVVWGGEWEEIDCLGDAIGTSFSVQCQDICRVGEAVAQGLPLRVFIRRASAGGLIPARAASGER